MNPSQSYSNDLLFRLRQLALTQGQTIPSVPSPPPSTSSASNPSASSKKKASFGSTTSLSDKGQQQQKKKKNSVASASSTLALNTMEQQTKDDSANEAVFKQMEALKKLLECPICLQLPSPPMYLCSQGHSVCQACRQRIKQCPLCQHPILATRNLLAEQIIGTLDTKCKFAGEGCTAMLLECEKKKHQANCHFRPLECNFAGTHHNCKNSMVKYTNFVNHLKSVHNMGGIAGTIMNVSQFVASDAIKLESSFCIFVDILWHEWPIQFMDACNQTFITGSAIMNGVIFWWLYVVGDRATAEKYRCKITLQNKEKKLEMTWIGPVMHIRTKPDLIRKIGLCLMVNKETLKAFTYPKTVREVEGNSVEKAAWDLVFSVFKA